jgi:hypothetical protein
VIYTIFAILIIDLSLSTRFVMIKELIVMLIAIFITEAAIIKDLMEKVPVSIEIFRVTLIILRKKFIQDI